MRRSKYADVPAGADNPLNAAVSARDRGTLDMVAAAVRHNQTLLAFQPIMVTHNRQVGFYEGLIRLIDTNGRAVPAARFIDAVETHGLGREIDRTALRLGIAELQADPAMRLSVNLSPRSIGCPAWLEVL